MPIVYRRMVDVRKGCEERFERLVQAYSNTLYATGIGAEMSLRRCGSGRFRFWMEETYPDGEAATEARKLTDFDRLWLPAIMTRVERYQLTVVRHPRRPGGIPPGRPRDQ